MKTIVLYKSKTGYTKNYANWLSKELNCSAYDINTIKTDVLKECDTIIYGGGLYAGGVGGLKRFKKLLEEVSISNVIIYFTGASTTKSLVLDDVISHNFTPEEKKKYQFYYLRGGFDYDKLSWIDKLLMIAFKARINSNKKKRDLTPDEKGMLEAYNQSIDFTNENRIQPLIKYVNTL